MKIAVIEDGAQQVIVGENQKIELAYRKNIKENEEITISNVLLINDEKNTHVGTPYVNNSKVILKFLQHTKDDKIRVFKYHPKTTYRRTKGHKQPHSVFQVTKIAI